MKEKTPDDSEKHIKIGSIQRWPHRGCTVNCQITVLSMLVIAALVLGAVTGNFNELDRTQIITLWIAIAGLLVVPVFNNTRKTELSAILFYFSLNLISLITFQLFQASPVETVLTYIFLLSLIVFLLQTVGTRIFAMLLIVIRFSIYAINAGAITDAERMLASPATPNAPFIYDLILLMLLVVVFAFYGWRLYLNENINKEKTQFSQHMTHDLQLSFKALSSTITVFGEQFEPRSDHEKAIVEEIQNVTHFYEYILNNFLDFSRLENVQFDNNCLEPIDLEAELEALIDVCKYTAVEKGLSIDLQFDQRFPTLINFDKVKITRIAINLLSNAIKNTTPGKAITLAVNWHETQWQLSIANEGPKIEEQEIQKMFMPHELADPGQPKKRLGLGLPITKRLVEALGGNISANSDQGTMTTFTVSFPYNKPNSLAVRL